MRQKLDALEQGIFEVMELHDRSDLVTNGIRCKCGVKLASLAQTESYKAVVFGFDREQLLKHPVNVSYQKHVAIEISNLIKEITNG